MTVGANSKPRFVFILEQGNENLIPRVDIEPKTVVNKNSNSLMALYFQSDLTVN